MLLYRTRVQGPCIRLFSPAAVSFHLVGSTDLRRRFCHYSPSSSATWTAVALPHHVRDFTPNLANLAYRLSHPCLLPHREAPRFLSSHLLIVLCNMGTGLRHRPTLRCMPGLAKTIFPCNTFAPHPGTPGSQTKATAPKPSATSRHISSHPPASQSPIASFGPGTAAPQPPMTLPVPEDWLQDSDCLDTRRSIGNLSCPRHVVSSSWDSWAREKGIAGIHVMNLHPAHFLYQGWNSYWLRWIASGKEAYFVVARTKAEMVLAGELLSQIRSQGLDIDAAATNHAVQAQTSQARNLAVKALAQSLVDQVKSKVPTETDYESQARIRELEGQIGSLQQQLQKQQQSISASPDSGVGPGTPGPSTPPPPTRVNNADRPFLDHQRKQRHKALQPKLHKSLPPQVKTCDSYPCSSAPASILAPLSSVTLPPSGSHHRKAHLGSLLIFQLNATIRSLKPGSAP